MKPIKHLKTEKQVIEPKDKTSTPRLKAQNPITQRVEKKALTSRKMQNSGNKTTPTKANYNEMRKEKNFPKFNIESFCAPDLKIVFESKNKQKQPANEPMQIFDSLNYDSYGESSKYI